MMIRHSDMFELSVHKQLMHGTEELQWEREHIKMLRSTFLHILFGQESVENGA